MKKLFVILIFFSAANFLYAREFLNTFMQINIGYSFSTITYGDIRRAEYKSRTMDKRLKYSDNSVNFMMDLTPFQPLIFYNDSHAIKFGFRGGYRLHYTEQRLRADKRNYKGTLLDYQCAVIGGLIKYAPNIDMFENLDESQSAPWGLSLYVLYGQMFNGHLDAFAAERAYGVSKSAYQTKLSGFRIDTGIGIEFAICAVNIGVNVYHSYIRFKLDRDIYASWGRAASQHEVTMEVYMGMPLVNLW